MRQRVAVTGASGFLGRHVVPELEERDCEVVTLGRSTANEIAFDLQDGTWPQSGAQRLVHLAWLGLPAYDDPVHLRQVPQHLACLDAALRSGIRHVTIAGTCFEYGMQEGALAEAAAAQPETSNLYAQGKDLLRREAEALCHKAGATLRWGRIFYIYGERRRRTLYTQLLDAIESGAEVFPLSPGDQVRDFLPVQEAAACLAEIALQDEVLGIINICRGRGITVREFVQSILGERRAALRLDLGYYPYSEFEPFAFWGDPTRMHAAREAYRREHRV
jgi:dTDP-6-deoxy-L-talose 4-dehydrogenase (NAD+)